MNEQAPDDTQESAKHGTRHLVIFLLTLAVISLGAHILFLGPSQLAGGDQLWRLSIDLTVETKARATAVRIFTPMETQSISILQRTLRHPGFQVRNWAKDIEKRRGIQAIATSDGGQSISAEFILQLSGTPRIPGEFKQLLLANAERERYLLDGDSLDLKNPLLVDTLRQLSGGLTDKKEQIEAIFRYLQAFAISHTSSDPHVPTTLIRKKATALEHSLAMVALCRAAGIPARLVSGILLEEDIEPRLHYWTEVYDGEQWLAFDIQLGYKHTVPANYLPLRRNDVDTALVLNGELLKLEYDIEREFDNRYLQPSKSRSLLSILDLTRLPLDARNELALLLLLPLGVLITALCRHLVGLRSYGVFTPTLLALALVYADKVLTLVIFLVVCALATAGRGLFPSTITRIPRLAIIFTMVAIILSLSVSVLDYYDFNQNGKLTLLPIIILTTLIDRLYKTIEDKGARIALHRLIWTILITLLCLPVIQFESLGHLMVEYPEGHLITLALFLLISRYKGKQLVTLPLIRLLAEPATPDKNKKPISD